MKTYITLSILIFIITSCNSKTKRDIDNDPKSEIVENEHCQIIMSSKSSNYILILFGGYGQNSDDIKREFDILDISKKNKIDLVLMNYSRNLWLEENEKFKLARIIQNTLEDNKLNDREIYIGGFSSGGLNSIHISNYILGNSKFKIDIKGLFIVDSPVDLLELHSSSKKNILRNYSDSAVKESNWLVQTLENKLGDPEKNISEYERFSVYTGKTNYIENLKNLKATKIRFYTEPDLEWWKTERLAEYEELNAYSIKKLYESLKNIEFENIVENLIVYKSLLLDRHEKCIELNKEIINLLEIEINK